MRFINIILCSIILVTAQGHIYWGTLDYQSESWEPLTSFCFGADDGIVLADFGDSLNNPDQYLLFYADKGDSWNDIQHNDNCWAKFNQSDYKVKTNSLVTTTTIKIAYGSRARWWYVVLANCKDGFVKVDRFNVTMLNGGQAVVDQHFSMDQQGLWEMSIFFFLAFLALLWLFIWTKVVCKKKDIQYAIHKLLIQAVTQSLFGVTLQLIHFTIYSNNGEGELSVYYTGRFFSLIPQITMIFILLALAKGWMIWSNKVPEKRKLSIVCFVFLLLYLIMVLWNAGEDTSQDLLDEYANAPGVAISILRLIAAVYFAYICFHTYQMKVETESFYMVLAFLGLCWFLSQPVIVLLATQIESYERFKIIYGLDMSLTTAFYILTWSLFRPCEGNAFIAVLSPTATPHFAGVKGNVFPSLAGPKYTPPTGRI